MFFKRLRHIKQEYHYNFTPEEIWPFIVDPLTLQSFEKESCYQIQSTSQTIGAFGSEWTEVHIGEACAGDIFDWTVSISDPPYVYQMTSPQHGIRQTVTYTLTPNANGCILKEETVFTPIFSKRVGSMIIFWSILATGLLVKFADDEEESMTWFENLEETLRANRS